ncbi:tetratricopeptide repeat protein [Pseudacidobacterium ailaaui]|uniref:tetratricopeptide repeat protein n=1 Tax=Pseudacidobacterium ailaaui TaxID=1382359 RepID=UPI00047BC8FF|nr:tetratricopeptide repeat protein [Pseudacidobacterium ailaaui]
MPFFPLRTALSPEERQLRQRLIFRDALALSSLFAIVVVLFFITLALFHSFSVHREELKQRWLARGEKALQAGQPQAAIQALRSALAYDTDDKRIQIELAQALAASGRTQEAVAYFNTLLESLPGNGPIHLELARLAAKEGQQAQALEHYQAALDGTWQGDGYVRRREVRLELAKYLISQKHLEQARTQLLIAAGNAPDDASIEMTIAGMLESAQDPVNALELYQKALQHKPPQLAALLGAGRSAYALGRFLLAKQYLERALNHPGFEKYPSDQQTVYRNMLADSDHILMLDPGEDLTVRARAERVLANRKTAQERLASCLSTKSTVPQPLEDLANQWQQLPKTIRLMQLERDPQLEQTLMQLVYQTETITAQQCGAPTGNDALLLKMAQNPEAVEQP